MKILNILLEILLLSSLVSSENVACIDFLIYIIQDWVVTIGDDGLTLFLELLQVVDNTAAEEGTAILEGWLIDYHLCTFSLDALHDSLDTALAEIVTVALHRESIHSDSARVFFLRIIAAVILIEIISSHTEHSVGDKVLTRLLSTMA